MEPRSSFLGPRIFLDGAWRSPVARMLWEHDVAGSNPAAPTREQQGCSVLQPLFYVLQGIDRALMHPVQGHRQEQS